MRLSIITALLLGGCSDQPGGAFRDVRDRIEAATGLPLLGLGPCGRASRDATFEAKKSIVEICYKLTSPRPWRGLWLNEFEGSRFCAAPVAQCTFEAPGDRVWLSYAFGLTDARPREWKVQPGGLYIVEFIGRRTIVKGSYGHLGGYDHAMVVDRMLSVQEVEPPPKQER